MKTFKSLIITSLLFTTILSCDKDENNSVSVRITGKWVHSNNYAQTLDFQSPTDVFINWEKFSYQIEGDSIEFKYNGLLSIALKPSKHRFEKSSDGNQLMIEDLNKTHFFEGKSGENILMRGIEPNAFIGYWINQEQQDSLIFLTNSRMERPNGPSYDWYEYAAKKDSFTLQYSGPDKVLIPPVNYGYEFKGDTLLINFHKKYHPTIRTGLKRYLKR